MLTLFIKALPSAFKMDIINNGHWTESSAIRGISKIKQVRQREDLTWRMHCQTNISILKSFFTSKRQGFYLTFETVWLFLFLLVVQNIVITDLIKSGITAVGNQ